MITDPATPAPPALTRPATTPKAQVRSPSIDYAMALPRGPSPQTWEESAPPALHDRQGPRLAGSGEVGLGDAVGMAGRPLDQLDPVAVRVGDPTGPRPVRAVRKPGRLGHDPL